MNSNRDAPIRSEVPGGVSREPTCRRQRGRSILWRAAGLLLTGVPAGLLSLTASEPGETRSGLARGEPREMLRIAQRTGEDLSGEASRQGEHPLDPALGIAREGLRHIQQHVRDYTATLVKRERIRGTLTDYQHLSVKVRHRQVAGGRPTVPFSVYLSFLAPRPVQGREVIWVEGRNGGKLVAHDKGLRSLFRVNLDPDGFVAMLGNRYPVTEIGIQNLVEQLIKKGERDRERGDCEVLMLNGARVDGRLCTMIQVTHPQREDHFDFYQARIFIEKDRQVPVYYAAWSWPEREGEPPVLEEEYAYRDIKLNVGLTDRDFDPDNPEYRFP